MPEAVVGAGIIAIIKKRWRGWLRAFHRDLGYLTVGLTIIYAVSGLAINHIGSWDPNFKTFHAERQIAKIPADVPDDVAIARAAAAIGLGDAAVKNAARYGDEIHFDETGHTVVVYGDSGLVVEDGRESRFFLRMANWLHEVRGKKAWMYIADLYAIILLYLAISGIFMIKGKLGLRWRGLVLVSAGALVPTLYVVLSGGPGAKGDKPPAEVTATAPAPAADVAPALAPAPPSSEPPPERMQPRTPPDRPPVPVPAPDSR